MQQSVALSKTRLENLSDAAFAIVFTLLVIEIRVPETLSEISNIGLWHALQELGPLFLGYAVSFAVLAMFWIAHNFFYSSIVKNVNRVLNGLNLLFLALIGLIPFSSLLLGTYGHLNLAVAIYGVNVLAIGVVQLIVFEYAFWHKDIDTIDLSSRTVKQARIRIALTSLFSVLGIITALFGSFAFSVSLYAFPIVFNIVPGLLDKAERLFGFEIQ